MSGGSRSAKPGAHVQECDRRPSPGDESANDDDVPWVRDRVNRRVVRGKCITLFGEICQHGGAMELLSGAGRIPEIKSRRIRG